MVLISWFEKHRKLSWIITIIIAVVMFILSGISFESFSGIGVGTTSIIYHVTSFFFLSGFLFISAMNGKRDFKLFWVSISILISYAILDELHQFFVPGRFSTLLDVGLDIIGIILASFVYFISLFYRKK